MCLTLSRYGILLSIFIVVGMFDYGSNASVETTFVCLKSVFFLQILKGAKLKHLYNLTSTLEISATIFYVGVISLRQVTLLSLIGCTSVRQQGTWRRKLMFSQVICGLTTGCPSKGFPI